MNIDLFKSLIAVAKHKNVSKATREIHLSQPAVTKHIRALEELYRMRVFERKNKRMILTEDGKRLLDYANQIVNLFDESLVSLNEDDGQLMGILKIGVNLTVGVYVMPRLIKLFSDTYPEVKIEMFLYHTMHIIRAVRRHDVNLGFVGIKLEDSLISHHLFYQDEMKVVMAPDFWDGKSTISLKELEALPFISWERGCGIRDTLDHWIRERGIKLMFKMELNNTEAIKECVQAGIGFSILPWCTLKKEVRAGELRIVSAPYLDLSMSQYICHYKDKKFSKTERVFLEFLFQDIKSRSSFLYHEPLEFNVQTAHVNF